MLDRPVTTVVSHGPSLRYMTDWPFFAKVALDNPSLKGSTLDGGVGLGHGGKHGSWRSFGEGGIG
jgi:hypothetical protein